MSGLKAVADALDGAHVPPIDGAPPSDGERRGKWLPDGCPVTALGTESGVFYFLTTLGELRGLSADKVANKNIIGLFAPDSDYLYDQWPRRKLQKSIDPVTGEQREEWVTTGWRTDDVSIALMDAAATRGVWNAQERVRGRGGWLADDGSLILHVGNHVLMTGGWQRPGLYDGKVYPAQPPLARPHPEPVTLADGPGHQLLKYLRTWNWTRPGIDEMLLLGWIVQAMMGAANEWRCLAWITGDKATGKSTLQKLVDWVLDGWLLHVTNATEAGVRQILGQQSLPVTIDEAEASEDNRKLNALLELARQASSGGTIARGGQNHEGQTFKAVSAFLFSSIYTPPMLPQDRSRMALLELKELEAGKRDKVGFERAEFREIGAQLRRIICDRWHAWPHILQAYRDALIDYGAQGGRAADQFGTLLAGAHLVLEASLPDEETLQSWGERLDVTQLAETADAIDDKTACLQYLTTSLVSIERGGTQRLVAEWIMQAMEPDQPFYGGDVIDAASRRKAADEALARIGLRVVQNKKGLVPGIRYLAVASMHQGLSRIYESSHWAGRSGAESVYAQALRRIPGAARNVTLRIGGVTQKCTCVPVSTAVIMPEQADQLEAAERAAERV
jgi:hypothetical protein